jgi:hypothetical protein
VSSPLIELERLFEPETVVIDGKRHEPVPGERRLLLAVLESAIRAALEPAESKLAIRERREARAWIMATRPRMGYGGLSFELCCTVNEIDPEWLRGGLCGNKLWQREDCRRDRIRLSRQHGLNHRIQVIRREAARAQRSRPPNGQA